MMKKLNFLLGDWDLRHNVPKSTFSEAMTGSGTGTMKRMLDDKYVVFDYTALVGGQKGAAHGIFAWDEKAQIYRYWWFENSGAFQQATCKFINDDTLFMNWHDSLLIQTFRKTGKDKVVLRMENPDMQGNFMLILEVIFTRKELNR